MTKKPLIGLISLLLAVSACATEAQRQQRIHVYVRITANSLIESGLLKRLREFKDVEITPQMEDAESGFVIVAVTLENKADRTVGYAITVAGVSGFPIYLVPPEALKLREFLTHDGKVMMLLDKVHLYSCGHDNDELSKVLEDIVADMDVEVFEPIRKMWAAGSRP